MITLSTPYPLQKSQHQDSQFSEILNSNLYTINYLLYIHGSVHRKSILIRSNKIQQQAGIYLLQNYSTCLGCSLHPSSGVHKTVTKASGTGHSI